MQLLFDIFVGFENSHKNLCEFLFLDAMLLTLIGMSYYSIFYFSFCILFLICFFLITVLLKVLTAIPFIAEFSLTCSNGETPALYADIDGVLVPVTQSLEGDKYQVLNNQMYIF